ncbi:gluconate 2-dehydrogenase subunit 3 family protein [Cohnella caldifontis]|uniref:gluconate 2-dehydrogenase subunit 3 family protein n=1 Tax=Cohnella caldifontis TaxID=3027471 RepID=UPI0023ECD559|nr:gluconate 2-dehydrogenase subunit 3 family protein [Cohnella sp. YIM B05605]
MAPTDEKKSANPPQVREPSRRKFLVNAGKVIGGVVVGGAIGGLVGCNPNNNDNANKASPSASPSAGGAQAAAEPKNYNRALMFFTQEQFRTVNAAVERIFPEDESGPGAQALGVAYFIDHQLAGEWGFNGREYMSPPFYHGETVQGYQGRLKRREIFTIAIQEMNNYSQAQFKKNFVDLAADQQDKVLEAFEKDQVQLTTISPSGFFKMLRASTLEGAYSDPLYGGNLNMAGWKMRDYPGNQMSYTDVIDKDFTAIAPSSLQDHMAAH